MTILVERLKQLRTQRGVTQGQVAEACGISPISLARYETGARTPTTEILARLAVYYGVSMDYLLGCDPAPDTAQPTEIGEPEIRILARDMAQLSPDRQKKAYDLLRMLMEEDDDDTIDQATRVIKALKRND